MIDSIGYVLLNYCTFSNYLTYSLCHMSYYLDIQNAIFHTDYLDNHHHQAV